MYRAFFCVGLILCFLGTLLALAGFVAPVPGPNGGLVIPVGIGFIGTGIIIISQCDQYRRLEGLYEKLLSLQSGNAELRMLAQNQAAVLTAMQQKLEQKEAPLSPAPHYNGQLPTSVSAEEPSMEIRALEPEQN